MRYLEAACLIVVTTAFVFLLSEGGLAVRDFRVRTLPQLTQAATDLDRSAIILGATATNIERSSRSWQTKQNAIADQASLAISTLNSDLKQMGALELTASSLIDSQKKSLSALESTASSSLTDFTSQAAPVIANLQTAAKNVSSAAGSLNQAIVETSPEVLATTKQLNETSKQLSATAADGREVADAYKQKLLHPVRSFWNGVETGAKWLIMGLEAHAFWP